MRKGNYGLRRLVVLIFLGAMLICPATVFAQESVADFLFEEGREYYRQGDYERALAEFKKVLLLDPQHTDALIYIEKIKDETERVTDYPEEEPLVEEEPVIEPEWAMPEPKAELKPERGWEPEQERFEFKPFEEALQDEPYPLLEKGKLFVELFTKYYWHNAHFDENGVRKSWDYNGKSYEVKTELKIEYGLTEALNLLCSIPYSVAVWKDDYNRNTTNGFGDIWLRAKYQLWKQVERPFNFYLQPGIRIPGGYAENASPALGKGDVAGEMRLIASRSFSALPCYTKLETGYRLRSDAPTDEIPFFFELGYHPTDWLMLKTTLDGIEGLAATGDDEEDWIKWTAHLIYSPQGGFSTFKKEGVWNFEFAYGNTFEGKNTSNGEEVILNITYQW